MSLDVDSTVKGLMRDRAKLLAYTHAIVRDREVAEDLFQEVVSIAIQKHDEISNADHLLLWARRAARNKALESLRKKKYRPLALDREVLDLLEAPWKRLDELDSRSEMDHLRECLDKLAPKTRKVVNLKFVDGLSGIQIAETVGNEVRSVYVALTRAYRSLEECIRRRRVQAEHGTPGAADA